MLLRKSLATRPAATPASTEAAGENATLLRYLGGVQQRCTLLIAELQQRLAELETDNRRLRAELRRHAAENASLRQQSGHQEASELLCRTGCLSLDQQWRDEHDHCRLDGRPCQHAEDEISAS